MSFNGDKDPTSWVCRARNVRILFSVLLVSIWNDINILKKITLMSFWMTWMQFSNFFYYIYIILNEHRRTLEEALALLVPCEAVLSLL
jgi:hypothetical protein